MPESEKVHVAQPRKFMFNFGRQRRDSQPSPSPFIPKSQLQIPLLTTTICVDETADDNQTSSVARSSHDNSSSLNIAKALQASNSLHPLANTAMMTMSVPVTSSASPYLPVKPHRHPLSYLKRESISSGGRRNSIMPDLMKSGGFANLCHSFQSNSTYRE
jgi:hypothetical protein